MNIIISIFEKLSMQDIKELFALQLINKTILSG
jgi:hypothetical protein